MSVDMVPQVLREKLGSDGTRAMSELLGKFGEELTSQWVNILDARLEKRLGETKSELDRRIGETKSELERRISETQSELERRLNETKTELERQLGETTAALVREIAATRVETEKRLSELAKETEKRLTDHHKWMFVFWITQLVAMIGVVRWVPR